MRVVGNRPAKGLADTAKGPSFSSGPLSGSSVSVGDQRGRRFATAKLLIKQKRYLFEGEGQPEPNFTSCE